VGLSDLSWWRSRLNCRRRGGNATRRLGLAPSFSLTRRHKDTKVYPTRINADWHGFLNRQPTTEN